MESSPFEEEGQEQRQETSPLPPGGALFLSLSLFPFRVLLGEEPDTPQYLKIAYLRRDLGVSIMGTLRETMKTPIATAALLFACAVPAFAQRDRDDFMTRRVSWYPSIEAAMGNGGGEMSEAERRRMRFFGENAVDKKYVFVYVRPLNEEKEPNEFQNQDVVLQSRGAW